METLIKENKGAKDAAKVKELSLENDVELVSFANPPDRESMNGAEQALYEDLHQSSINFSRQKLRMTFDSQDAMSTIGDSKLEFQDSVSNIGDIRRSTFDNSRLSLNEENHVDRHSFASEDYRSHLVPRRPSVPSSTRISQRRRLRQSFDTDNTDDSVQSKLLNGGSSSTKLLQNI